MDDTELIKRLRSNDNGAFDEFVQAYGPRLLRAARLLTGQEQLSEELASDTFAEAFLALGRFRGQCSLFSWLYSIMLNQYRSLCRKQKYLVPLQREGDCPEKQNTDNPVRDDRAKNIPLWLSQLSPEHRCVVALKYLEQKNIEEISVILDVPAGTVKSRLHNAIYSLKEIVKKQEV